MIEQIVVSAASSNEEMFDIARARIKKTRALSYSGEMYIYKHSVDARHKESIRIVVSVCAEVEAIRGKENIDLSKFGIKLFNEEKVTFTLSHIHVMNWIIVHFLLNIHSSMLQYQWSF